MATSAQGYAQQPYETAVGYDDWLAATGLGKEPYSGAYSNEEGSWESVFAGNNFLGNTIGKLLGYKQAYTDRYNKYVEALNKRNEERAIANARAYDEWFESTKYQRAVADLKKAGLNPWLAVNSGFANQSPATTTNSSAKGVEYQVAESKGVLSALLGALAKIIAS